MQHLQTCDDEEEEGLEREMAWTLPGSHLAWNK